MSRGEALRTFTTDDLKEQTKGIECDKSEGVLDEIPGAYKSIEQVMEQQSDLVEIVAQLRQVLCVKDNTSKSKNRKAGKKHDHKE
jgi:tRNA-splicing ligase RtcB